MRFIFPRLLGLLAIAGLGMLLLSLIFKLLLTATVIAAIVHFGGRAFHRRRYGMHGHRGRHQMEHGYQPFNGPQPYDTAYHQGITPMRNRAHNAGIIPVN